MRQALYFSTAEFTVKHYTGPMCGSGYLFNANWWKFTSATGIKIKNKKY